MFVPSSKVDLGNLVRDYNVEVIGIVEYDDLATDNMNLVNRSGKAFFRTKNKNQDTFSKAVKSL